MKPDTQLVRRLRDAVRSAVRACPHLQRDRRKPPGLLRRHWGWGTLRWLVSGVFLFAAALGASPAPLLGFAALWTLCIVLSRATQLGNRLQAPDHLWPYYEQPIANATVFDLQRRAWLCESIWSTVDWTALGVGLAIHDPSMVRWVLTLPLGLAQGATTVALAAWLVRRSPRFPFGFLFAGTCVLLFLCVKFFESGLLAAFIEPLFRWLQVLTPAGWLAKSYAAAVALQPAGWIGLFSLGAVSLLLIAPALHTLRRDFRMEPIFGYSTEESPAAGPTVFLPNQEPSLDDHGMDQLTPIDAAALPAPDPPTLRQRLTDSLAADPAQNLGPRFLESRVRGCLTTREKILVESLRLAPVMSWSRGWSIALGLLVFARLSALAGLPPVWPSAITTTGLVLFGLPVFGGIWRGFDSAPSLHYKVGLHSYLPVGFWEGTRVILKINLLRVAAGIPLLLLGIRYGYDADLVSWSQAFALLWRVLILLLVIQPLWVVVNFSKTTNDSSARWWFSALLVCAILSSLLALVIGAVMMFGISEAPWPLVIGAGLLLYSLLLLTGYGLAYRGGVFDLMNPQPASS